jgi:hypothetical protein
MRQTISHQRISLLFLMIAVAACASISVKAWFNNGTSVDPAGFQGTGYQIVVGETAVNNMVSKQLIVNCPRGKRATGAGWSVLDRTSAILDGQSTYSEPSFDGSSWMVNAKNNSSFSPNWKLRIRLICAVISN